MLLLTTDTLGRGSGTVGPKSLFNPPNLDLQSRTISITVCVLSIAHSIFTNLSTVSMLILFDIIKKCVLACYYMTIIYALMVLFVAMLVNTITILYYLII